jgi:hypothetical protein
MIDNLISSVDVNAIPSAIVISGIIPGLNLSYERDFGGGRYQGSASAVDVLRYSREISVFGAKRQMRTRLLLVGAGYSGKTTLVRRLVEVIKHIKTLISTHIRCVCTETRNDIRQACCICYPNL